MKPGSRNAAAARFACAHVRVSPNIFGRSGTFPTARAHISLFRHIFGRSGTYPTARAHISRFRNISAAPEHFQPLELIFHVSGTYWPLRNISNRSRPYPSAQVPTFTHRITLPPEIFTDSPTILAAASVSKNVIVLATSSWVVMRPEGMESLITSSSERPCRSAFF
ncbi:hypothetical protein SAMN05216238_10839 [Lentibacillus persicus]|uniref:Uncharacterized protein n=1 Tax=Lentibacillus persicus TaxID=640948 RepID=A0A1I1XRS0_9BACI|nr:hypothetical protein SAMN05216238_10839 [Lentibacillus persicus]